MDLSKYLYGKNRRYTLIGIVMFFVLIGFVIFLLTLKPGGNFRDSNVHATQTWLRAAIGVDFVDNKFYFSNGHQIVSFDPNSGKTEGVAPHAQPFYPSISGLKVSRDKKFAVIESFGNDTLDQLGLELFKKKLPLDNRAYWWKLEFESGRVTLLTNKQGRALSLLEGDLTYDESKNKWWAMDLSGRSLHRFDQDMNHEVAVSLPGKSVNARVIGDQVYMTTKSGNDSVFQKATLNEDSLSKPEVIETGVAFSSFSPDNKYVFLGSEEGYGFDTEGKFVRQNRGEGHEGKLVEVSTGAEVFRHTYGHTQPSFTSTSDRLYFSDVENPVARYTGLTYKDLPGDNEEFAVATSDPHKGMYRVIAGNKDFQFIEATDGDTFLLSAVGKRHTKLKFDPKGNVSLERNGIRIVFDSAIGVFNAEYDIRDRKVTIDYPASREAVYKLLRDNGYNPDFMNVRIWYVDASKTPIRGTQLEE